ncbi:MAG: hypothetical protein J6B13_09670 [Muribaculaceae bacterium]|nr:hypothetical protein [Muribaculaceae bacterium]
MYKVYYLLISLLFVSCSNDGPESETFMQIASITNEGEYISQQFSYDSYGRVVTYRSMYPTETVTVEYEYVSDNLIKITTKDINFGRNGIYDVVRTYQDNLHLESGRAAYCEGIFCQTEQNKTSIEKKYRHEFSYTSGNLLNVVKWTEWNKEGDGWAEDKPWTWENFYYWDNGNLMKIEDFNGNSYPSVTYTFNYTDVAGVQNIVPIPMGRYQYIPLQLKGIFGAQSVSLISEVHRDDSFNNKSTSTSYRYESADSRITKYQESRNNGITETFSVIWTE